ncbi:STAS domain-containing protein [Pararobbsia alpina]|uniref:STAS domain-containing protein n=1 Tax=Pararobbsia alpina TaxID=621374 RepID=UPI0039A48ECD
MSQPTRVALGAELTIYRAAELRESLLAHLAQPFDVLDIDLSDVAEIDSSGIQLLLATQAAVHSLGRSIVLHDPSEPVRDVCGLLNLGSLFATEPAAIGKQDGAAS